MSDNVTYMYGKEVANDLTEDDNIVESWSVDDNVIPFVLNDTVTIPKGEYEELLNDSMFLGALVISGVDNWEGYEEASDLFDAWNEEVAD